jgi:Niemann-Pick C1 protein
MRYARVGPPVMFVVEGMNISEHSPDIDAVAGCARCNVDSLVNAISHAAQDPLTSHIASPAASWIDDFLAWIQPELPNCCRVHTNGAHEGEALLRCLRDATPPHDEL